jgi:hypothetical protein
MPEAPEKHRQRAASTRLLRQYKRRCLPVRDTELHISYMGEVAGVCESSVGQAGRATVARMTHITK